MGADVAQVEVVRDDGDVHRTGRDEQRRNRRGRDLTEAARTAALVGQHAVRANGSGQVSRGVQVHARQVKPEQPGGVSAREVGAGEARRRGLKGAQDGRPHRAGEVRARQIGAREVGADHQRPREVGTGQVGTGEVRAGQVGHAEVPLGQVAAGQINVRQVGFSVVNFWPSISFSSKNEPKVPIEA